MTSSNQQKENDIEILTARINACKHPRLVYNALMALAPIIREAKSQKEREALCDDLKGMTASTLASPNAIRAVGQKREGGEAE